MACHGYGSEPNRAVEKNYSITTFNVASFDQEHQGDALAVPYYNSCPRSKASS